MKKRLETILLVIAVAIPLVIEWYGMAEVLQARPVMAKVRTELRKYNQRQLEILRTDANSALQERAYRNYMRTAKILDNF